MDLLVWLVPWEFSPTLLVCFAAASVLFARGCRHQRVGRLRQILFWTGMVVLYLSMHTRLDYYAERMFFIHRAQHVVLHHLAPLLIMAAYPGSVMRAGLPLAWRAALRRFTHTPLGKAVVWLCTNPFLVATAFVLLVLIWLVPSIQFYAMLDWKLYRLMNWSVVLSGILYWNLLLDRRPSPPAALSPGLRVLSPVLTMTPQIIAGAVLTFSERDFYPVYDVCGRALAMSAQFDQNLGGLILWIPAGIIETVGGIVALRTLMRLSGRGRLRQHRRQTGLQRQTGATP
ncbi:cytochrome c oxidase assembly protein [Verticiella sediminum]|uniref:Cytochrome c oxidase assembly protein n=1 Tax=Verticiella sediminum TaxID=1247510 RepID=A0A556AVP2_9BURK|nr:cytochrome c oxidase assembly protein [Verticiella sediminum]TSH97018.1 cytochrome c oxidase assembly protein [Verticiella sediminum]